MTFNTNVPNAAQSPGLFPAQNNTNFARLKTIINNDHIFNDTAAANDGTHRQVTLTDRAIPGSLPTNTNAILYTWLDTLGRSQLRYYNGIADWQLTPYDELLPIGSKGSASLATGASQFIFNPSYNWAGTGWAIIQSGSILVFRFYNIIRIGSSVDINQIDTLDSGGTISRPTLSFSGTALQITNNDASTRTVTWSLIVNRLP